MLFFEYPAGELVFIVPFKNRDCGLKDYGAGIHSFINKMDSAPRNFDPILDCLSLGMETRKAGEECRVDVYYLSFQLADDSRSNDSHITGEDIQVG